MNLLVQKIDIPPDPVRIARALASEPGFAFLWSGGAGERGAGGAGGAEPSYVACCPVARAVGLDPEPLLELDPRGGPLTRAPRWMGLLPYECRRGIERPRWTRTPEDRPPPHLEEAIWYRYGAVVRVADDVLVVGDDPVRVQALVALVARDVPPAAVHARAEGAWEPDRDHAARIQRALELIVEGEIYQVNLARRFDFLLRGSPVDLLVHLAGPEGAPHAAAFDWEGLTVVASSPELLLELGADGRLTTCPIKGTRPRGRDGREDRALALELDSDPKERAELAMVIDVERNDLGRVATTGSVSVTGLPRVETFGTVHHRVARVTAALRPGTSRQVLLEAVLPSGSVTGAPKIRAMEIIATLETSRRGLYTGGFGALGHDGSLRLGMAIRTVTAREGHAEYFAGGGIVFGSDPAREVEETRWKAERLLALLGERP